MLDTETYTLTQKQQKIPAVAMKNSKLCCCQTGGKNVLSIHFASTNTIFRKGARETNEHNLTDTRKDAGAEMGGNSITRMKIFV